MLGLPTGEEGFGALSASAPLALSIWRSRASISMLVTKVRRRQGRGGGWGRSAGGKQAGCEGGGPRSHPLHLVRPPLPPPHARNRWRATR